MKCPACFKQELVPDTRDIDYSYRGETTQIPDVKGEFCPSCGEIILDAKESSRVSSTMNEFNKQVNSSVVAPGYIAGIRKKLGLDQKEAAEIFGGGVNAFSRYETGKTRPSLALVKLLRILDSHPELLPMIK